MPQHRERGALRRERQRRLARGQPTRDSFLELLFGLLVAAGRFVAAGATTQADSHVSVFVQMVHKTETLLRPFPRSKQAVLRLALEAVLQAHTNPVIASSGVTMASLAMPPEQVDWHLSQPTMEDCLPRSTAVPAAPPTAGNADGAEAPAPLILRAPGDEPLKRLRSDPATVPLVPAVVAQGPTETLLPAAETRPMEIEVDEE
ncbi:hypothetical protein NESM_000892800 [Novymonas esmeraldas]|uniref:Uncharacterized protein n=1 Tax=Novymonas esmeraldas TaxID=1808958 RepID=A0AAW0EZK4_9TRYP